jgi:hypothetical protein
MNVSLPDAPITFDFEVTEQSPGERVGWHCLAGPPEWIGTDLSFEIQTDADVNTSVLFSHDGWASTEESFPAETGTRDPFFDF